jgi:hypothetical protein
VSDKVYNVKIVYPDGSFVHRERVNDQYINDMLRRGRDGSTFEITVDHPPVLHDYTVYYGGCDDIDIKGRPRFTQAKVVPAKNHRAAAIARGRTTQHGPKAQYLVIGPDETRKALFDKSDVGRVFQFDHVPAGFGDLTVVLGTFGVRDYTCTEV